MIDFIISYFPITSSFFLSSYFIAVSWVDIFLRSSVYLLLGLSLHYQLLFFSQFLIRGDSLGYSGRWVWVEPSSVATDWDLRKLNTVFLRLRLAISGSSSPPRHLSTANFSISPFSSSCSLPFPTSLLMIQLSVETPLNSLFRISSSTSDSASTSPNLSSSRTSALSEGAINLIELSIPYSATNAIYFSLSNRYSLFISQLLMTSPLLSSLRLSLISSNSLSFFPISWFQ